MRYNLVIKLVFASLMLFLFAGYGAADIYFETEQVSKGLPGQPDGSSILKQYLSNDGSRTDIQDNVTITDFNAKVMYELNDANKTYTRSAIAEFNAMQGMGGGPESDQEANIMQAMIQSMANSLKVTPTDEYKEIAGYKCRKYNVTVMMANSEYWATKDFKGYDELKTIGQKASEVFSDNPMLKQMNIVGIMKEIDGFPVRTITQVMGGTVTSTLKKLEQKKLDKTLFQVPKGYTLVMNEK